MLVICFFGPAASVPYAVFNYAVGWYIASIALAIFLGLLAVRWWILMHRNRS